jgi:hypothetical protein
MMLDIFVTRVYNVYTKRHGVVMPKEIPAHRDKLGRVLSIGDCVVYPQSNALIVGTIKKFNPKMIKVAKVPASKWGGESNKYPSDLVRVDGPEVTMYLIKSAGQK